jgi:hypothetical protein
MHLPRALRRGASALLLIVPIACSSSPPSTPRTQLGRSCTADSECATGRCDPEQRACTTSCSTDQDCRIETGANFSCVHSPDGDKCWFQSCPYAHYGEWRPDANGNVCDNGHLEPCDTYGTCGCTDCGDGWCQWNSGTCKPIGNLGAVCEAGDECKSGDCQSKADATGLVCVDPVGGPCTDATCPYCRQIGNTTQCATPCIATASGGSSQCPGGFWCGSLPTWSGSFCLAHCPAAGCPNGSKCTLGTGGLNSTCD